MTPDDPPRTRAGAVDVSWPWGFEMRVDGLVFAPPAPAGGDPPTPLWICDPFAVLGLSRTEDGSGWGRVLRFDDPDGLEKTVVIAAADLAGDGAAVRQALASAGLTLSSRRAAREKLAEALTRVKITARVRLRDRVGWSADGSSYAMPAETIGSTEAVILEGQAKGAHFATVGSLDDWRAWIAADVGPHDLPVFFVALAFAGPLLEPLGVDGGGFHLVGKSSSGKSTVLTAAASVWGGREFAQSWRATSNALEAVAAAHNDALLALDEIGICAPADVGIAAYILSGGAGKQRLKTDGDLRALRRWRIAVASTGELGLAEKIAEDGRHRVMAGMETRLVDLRLDPERRTGAFDGDLSPEACDRLARRIKTAASTFFGTAGPAFVTRLVADRGAMVDQARRTIADFTGLYVPEGADGQVARVGARFALVAAAGELATTVGVLPFAADRVSDAAGRLFEAWVVARGGIGAGEDAQALARLRAFILTNGAARFQRLQRESEPDAMPPSDESWRAQMLAGYKTATHWLFHEAAFAEALGGLDPRAAAQMLFRQDLLDRDGRHLRRKVSTPKGRLRLYAVRNAILEEE